MPLKADEKKTEREIEFETDRIGAADAQSRAGEMLYERRK
jgi:hypothetical protein